MPLASASTGSNEIRVRYHRSEAYAGELATGALVLSFFVVAFASVYGARVLLLLAPVLLGLLALIKYGARTVRLQLRGERLWFVSDDAGTATGIRVRRAHAWWTYEHASLTQRNDGMTKTRDVANQYRLHAALIGDDGFVHHFVDTLPPWGSFPEGWSYDHRAIALDLFVRDYELQSDAHDLVRFLRRTSVGCTPGVPQAPSIKRLTPNANI